MSFSHDVKREICKGMTDSRRRFGCLYGMLMFCKYFNEKEIKFRTGCLSSAELFEGLIKEFFSKSVETAFEEQKNGEKASYTYTIMQIKPVIERFCLQSRDSVNAEFLSKYGAESFFAGAFLACGSVNDPKKDYHFEFCLYNKNICDEFSSMITEHCGVEMKKSTRRGVDILYVKDSRSIEELLALVGATRSAMDVMLIKIDKNDNNYVNRITNCDSANIDKIVSASQKQVEAINSIIDNNMLETLSEDLREIALLRLENPEMSLRELGEALKTPIGRSGVNHRMNRLLAIAKQLKLTEKT